MLTASDLQNRIAAFMKTSDGESRIKAAINNNPALLKKQSDNFTEAVGILADLIYVMAPPSISESFTRASIVKGISGPYPTPEGYSIQVNFDETLLRRPSLNPNNEGVYNIAGLLIKGWSTSSEDTKTPFGMWHDKMITGLPHREPMKINFIKEAVNTFLLNYGAYYGVLDCAINDAYLS